jgi:SagB-type dehydrogenase family enzyme
LLDAAAGVTATLEPPRSGGLRQPVRAWPSAGGLYPIELYPVILRGADLEPGIHHFDPCGRRLARIGQLGQVEECIYADGLLEGASLLLLLTAVLARTQDKYGERGYRLALLDAGHLGQNLLLAAEDLRLGAVAIGGFDDDGLAKLLQLDPAQEPPVHVLLIGSKR